MSADMFGSVHATNVFYFLSDSDGFGSVQLFAQHTLNNRSCPNEFSSYFAHLYKSKFSRTWSTNADGFRRTET